ncbi:MAG: cysteine desulfuration protein SufE [Flammeovirgaceae bacterium]|jgi:cysteine desulfuration protein SufE
MTTTEIQNEIIEEFSLFDNKNDQYNYIIDLGKSLETMEESKKVDENIIKGCQSKVWLATDLADDKFIQFKADSDAIMVKGLVFMLVRILSNRTPQEILDTELFFMEKVGLNQMLSMTRSNGLASMIKQMKLYALAYQAKLG